MKKTEALKYLDEIGMTPQFFCELGQQEVLKQFLRSWHQFFHPKELPKTDKEKDYQRRKNAVYAKMTSALTSLSRLEGSELTRLVSSLEKLPIYSELYPLKEENDKLRKFTADLKSLLEEKLNLIDNLEEKLSRRKDYGRVDSSELERYKRKASKTSTYLRSLLKLAVNTFEDRTKFPSSDYPDIYNFLKEAKNLSLKFDAT